MRRLLALALLVLPLAFGGAVALAENYSSTKAESYPGNGKIVGVGYEPDKTTSAYRSTISVVDTLTNSNLLSLPKYAVRGRQTIFVGGRFSSASATVTIRLVYCYEDSSGNETIKGYSQKVTLTADSSQYEGSYYPAPDSLFDSEAAVNVRVIVTTAPSAGTVDFWAGS